MLSVQADVDNIYDLETALSNGANGIGILRTESLYKNNIYGEEQQYQYYSKLFAKCGENLITVRTFDGGENVSPLGRWGVRYSIANPEIFQKQLSAILRAGKDYNLRIAIPGVADIDQFRWVKEQLLIVRKQLDEKGILYNNSTPIGIMVEIPALVICLEMMTHEVNFYIVDSDKLLKYLMAWDADAPLLKQLSDPFHPALLRSIKQIIDAKPDNRLDVMVCGAVTELKQAIPILQGIGVSGIAVKPKLVTTTKAVTNGLKKENAIRIASKALVLSHSDKIKLYVNSALSKLGL